MAYESSDAAELIARAHAYNEALYGHPDETPVAAEEFSRAAGGLFLVGYKHDRPVACGGYRRHLDDRSGQTAEIKRMYVDAEQRRQGIARAVLIELEQFARRAGYRRAILDTGSKQHEAHALYEHCGYTRIDGFSIYKDRPGNRAYAKKLR